MNLREVALPDSLEYSFESNNKPYDFYYQSFEQSKNVYFLLGYFSSNAIQTIIPSFCQFLNNDGKLFFAINQFISRRDYNELFNYESHEEIDNSELVSIFEDIKTLRDRMSKSNQFFFNCLRYLHKNDRLNFVIIKPRSGTLSHYKKAMFDDGENQLLTNGSSNFTANGLVINAESFDVSRSWGSDAEKLRIDNFKKTFREIYNNEDKQFEYLSKNDLNIIEASSNDKSLKELLLDGIEILSQEVKRNPAFKDKLKRYETSFREKVEQIENEPRFPFDKPRDYQVEAYQNWVKNDYSGVFAMATGTGKTLTSLNCLLNECKRLGYCRAIILVPSLALLDQWEIEVNSFNFKNVLKIGGGSKWEKEFANYVSNYKWGVKKDIILISTYGSFVLDKFQNLFQNIHKDFLLIADEAHNMGANRIKHVIQNVNPKMRIGLSATPKRIYDPEGTSAIDSFFKDKPPYTYNFGMERALRKGYLTEYKYYPIIVELTESELEEYLEISKRLLIYFDFVNGKFKDDPIVEMLLLKRKSIIHKASNKLITFNSILGDLKEQDKLKYIFAYIPEGFSDNNKGESEKILEQFLKSSHAKFPELKMNSYTSQDQDLKEILRGFSEGKINLLLAMKMLDEGVDVPRAEIGIFASSTGNPRQFIQRRGRLLRKHKDKTFSTIYDMVVIPTQDGYIDDNFKMERNLVKNELNRVAYFASLSTNFYDTKENLENICKKYELNLDTIINEL
ncbi:MAG: DEAD/DEAH box helicase family protein [Weeksellaceae bacterium]